MDVFCANVSTRVKQKSPRQPIVPDEYVGTPPSVTTETVRERIVEKPAAAANCCCGNAQVVVVPMPTGSATVVAAPSDNARLDRLEGAIGDLAAAVKGLQLNKQTARSPVEEEYVQEEVRPRRAVYYEPAPAPVYVQKQPKLWPLYVIAGLDLLVDGIDLAVDIHNGNLIREGFASLQKSQPITEPTFSQWPPSNNGGGNYGGWGGHRGGWSSTVQTVSWGHATPWRPGNSPGQKREYNLSDLNPAQYTGNTGGGNSNPNRKFNVSSLSGIIPGNYGGTAGGNGSRFNETELQ
jgi:hypothetical protein